MRAQEFLELAVGQLVEQGELRCMVHIDPLRPGLLQFAYIPLAGIQKEKAGVTLPLSSDPKSAKVEVDDFLSALCERFRETLEFRHSQHHYALRCYFHAWNEPLAEGEFIQPCRFTVTRSEKTGTPSTPPAERKLAQTLMAPVVDRLVAGERVLVHTAPAEEAVLHFHELDATLSVGPVTRESIIGELIPSLLRFLGNDVRERLPGELVSVQGALCKPGEAFPGLAEDDLLFEIRAVWNHKGPLH